MASISETIRYRDNLPVGIRMLQVEDYPWRHHDCLTIAFALAGEVSLKLSYSQYKLSKGDVHIIHNDDVYGLKKLSESNIMLLMHFNVAYFKNEFPSIDRKLFTTKLTANPAKHHEQERLKQTLLAIASYYAKAESGYEHHVVREASQALQILHDHFQSFALNQQRGEFEYKKSYDVMQSERINHIISYIYENYDSKLSLSDIAKNVSLDKYYLSHLFQRYIGENFRTFVSMVRVELSEVMLLETDASVSQIAADVGFSDAKYYTENFKVWFGCTPKEYRKTFRRETLAEKETKAKEIPAGEYAGALEAYAGEAPPSFDVPADLQGILKAAGDLLEIEIIPKSGDFTYKLKINTENIAKIQIVPGKK